MNAGIIQIMISGIPCLFDLWRVSQSRVPGFPGRSVRLCRYGAELMWALMLDLGVAAQIP